MKLQDKYAYFGGKKNYNDIGKPLDFLQKNDFEKTVLLQR